MPYEGDTHITLNNYATLDFIHFRTTLLMLKIVAVYPYSDKTEVIL
jgi:hypothetical protein